MSTLRINLSTVDNPFKFISPIRRFKDNDPYVSVVDNIPIRQLEENILWLKQAFESATIDIQTQTPEFGREQFTELKPFVEINTLNNVVFVKPGRFTARINDAYNLTPLQTLTRLTLTDPSQYETWDAKSVDDASLLLILNRIKSLNPNDALGMNGLTERNFVSPFTLTVDTIYDPVASLIPGATDVAFSTLAFNLGREQRYPTFFSFLWGNGNNTVSETAVPYLRNNTIVTKNGRSLFYNESDFVKRWRGVARTAVVDVPTTLSATIENFSTDDFNYYGANGQLNTSLSSEVTSRIDLLFIYSKPIDQTETYIAEYTDGAVTSGYGNSPSAYSPRKLIKAELGIMKGAGIQMGYNSTSQWFFTNVQTALNRPEILASVTDQLNENLGFTELAVKGSFPSPDDLMNTAPLLAEWLPKRHFSLVGQTVLPIAYIVVRKDSLNATGNQALLTSDVIDIRPFFRTTELAYNERAGLAAAIPQVSLMNPVATETYVDSQIKKLLEIINNIPGPSNQLTLLKDQYNEIYIDVPTNKLLNTNPVYFGGTYFATWPITPVRNTIPTGTGVLTVAGLSEAAVEEALANWAQGRDTLPDGIYKYDKGNLGSLNNTPIWEQREATLDQVRWYIFTLQRLPLKIGTISNETWDLLIEPVKALSINTFVQSPRDASGFPLINVTAGLAPTFEYNVNRIVGTGALGTQIVSVGTLNAFIQNSQDREANYVGFYVDSPLNFPMLSKWYESVRNPFRYNSITVFEEKPMHWLRLDGGSLVPGWLIQQDFNGTKQYNNDFKCFSIKYRPNNTAPRQITNSNPYDIKLNKLYKAPQSSYGNVSVDIKVALMISNRIMVKDIGLKISNMRVS